MATLTVGAIGSGKSVNTLPKIVQAVADDLALVVVMDETRKLGMEAALHLKSLGLGGRIDYDDLGRFSKVLGGLSPEQSIEPDSFRRGSENVMRVHGWQDVLWSASERPDVEGSNIHTMPSLQISSEMATRLVLFQSDPARRDFSLFPFTTRVGHPEWLRLVNETTDDEAQEWFRDCIDNKGNKKGYRELEEKIGALHRLIKQAFTPQFRERLAGESHLEEALQAKKKRIIILDGGDTTISRRAVTSTFRA